jgi:transposase
LRDLPTGRLASTAAGCTVQAAPGLGQRFGVGAEIAGALLVAAGENPGRLPSEAAFAMLWGASPVQASSARRCGIACTRAASSGQHGVVPDRGGPPGWHQPTRDYLARRTREGLSKREIIRCLKRSVAREVFAALQAPTATADPT